MNDFHTHGTLHVTSGQLMWLAPDSREDSEAGEKGHFVQEASSLKLDPGTWPSEIHVTSDRTGNVARYTQGHPHFVREDLVSVHYAPDRTCPNATRTRGVVIYND